MDVLVISNPNSTSITQSKLASIIPTLRSIPDLHILSQFTRYAGHAEELARRARTQGFDAVICIGGDGTVSEVINGLLDEPTDDPNRAAHSVLTSNLPALGIIPTGSANVFARSVGYAPSPDVAVRQLAQALKNNQRRTVPLGAWADLEQNTPRAHRWFAVNVGLGIDAEVIHEMEKRRELGLSASPLRYVLVSVQTWFSSTSSSAGTPSIHVKAEAKDGPMEVHNSPLAFVSHTDPWTYLGPFPVRIVKEGSMERGFSVFTLKNRDGWRALLALGGLINPVLRRLMSRQVQTVSNATSVEIRLDEERDFQVDGEYKGSYSAVGLKFIPDAMEILSPR